MKQVVWMFSGQGSQYFNMGRDLYDADAEFRAQMRRCDEAYRTIAGGSLLEVIYPADPRMAKGEFAELRLTHPALFCIQYSLAQTLLKRGWQPDLLLGYSLGEIVAAAVAGAASFEELLGAVVQQAEVLAREAQGGAMLAVLTVPSVVETGNPSFAGTWVAARNFASHFVLSGPVGAIERAERELRAREISVQRLPVPVAFHCPAMDVVETRIREIVGRVALREPRWPLVSVSRMEVLARISPEFFWQVVRQPVRFDETVSWLEARGPHAYVDLGPSGTLATFLKYALPRGAASASAVYPIMTYYNRAGENLRRLEDAMAGRGERVS